MNEPIARRLRGKPFLIAAGVLACAASIFLAIRGRPPQMGADEEAFRTVDALFTAVTARDAKGVTDCETRLRACAAAGRLTPEAAEWLGETVTSARGGDWKGAADRLYRFMQAQRREGPREPQKKSDRKKP